MQNYNTTEEKAVEWNISSRYIQYLCRTGKIDGVIKRAGAWFIPVDATLPVKNTKSNVKDFRFVGTKNKIFEDAIQLFMLKGFSNVSLRDIAESVGIRQSTIYNHFKSKQEILDTIYDFYCHYFLKDRPNLEEMEIKLQSASFHEIMNLIRYDFQEEYRQKMSDITKIIFQRVAIDDRAREIGKSLMIDEGIKYVEDIFKIGIENGRFAPFDTGTMAVFINSIRIFTLFNWIVDPSLENMVKLAESEQKVYGHAAEFLTDLNPNATIIRNF